MDKEMFTHLVIYAAALMFGWFLRDMVNYCKRKLTS